MPPEYSPALLVSRMTCGSVRSAFSRNRFPALTRSTRSFRGSGTTAWTTLSASRSSRTSATALTTAPPWRVKGTMTFRFTWGSSAIVCSLIRWSSTVSPSGNETRSSEKFVTERNAW